MCCTPAFFSAASRFFVDVLKKSMTSPGSKEGAFVTSKTTLAPCSAASSPSPVRLFTPVLGDATTTSRRRADNKLATLLPIRPVPPTTTIFIFILLELLAGRGGSSYRRPAVRLQKIAPHPTASKIYIGMPRSRFLGSVLPD